MIREEFSIPIIPYLKKYVEQKCFNGLTPPYRVSRFSLLGKTIENILVTDSRAYIINSQYHEFSERLRVVLSTRLAKRHIDQTRLFQLNNFIDRMFKDDLISWNLSAIYHGLNPHIATINFLAFYKISEFEYSPNAGYKAFLKWRTGPSALYKNFSRTYG